MREIKCRAKVKESEKWSYGYYVELRDGQKHSERIYTGAAETDCGDYYPEYYEVIPETVSRFTGLNDKDGAEIYEDDIIKAWSQGLNATGQVVHRIDGLWIMYPAYQKQIMWGLMPDGDGTTTVEIIGNIYDNPELLGGI